MVGATIKAGWLGGYKLVHPAGGVPVGAGIGIRFLGRGEHSALIFELLFVDLVRFKAKVRKSTKKSHLAGSSALGSSVVGAELLGHGSSGSCRGGGEGGSCCCCCFLLLPPY